MIRAIGLDAVEIERFAHWNIYSDKQLRRIFSNQELSYSFKEPSKQAERLAVRFAAKEAFLKALSSCFPTIQFSLLTLCSCVEVKKINNLPQLEVDWDTLEKTYKTFFPQQPSLFLSLTHAKTLAIAMVLIEV